MGFPAFKMRRDQRHHSEKTIATRYRDSHHATGTATSWSNRREGTMAVNVRPPERSPIPGRSAWEGMSGAAVFSGDQLIGVIGKHHLGDGPGTLSAYRIDHLYEYLATDRIRELTTLIGLPGTCPALTEVLAVRPRAEKPPQQLPSLPIAFMGREDELAELISLGSSIQVGLQEGAVSIAAVDGMGGVGKTALTLHAAHHLTSWFPDGQLFLDLHGHTAGRPPREPGEALDVLLRGLGMPSQQLSADVDARAALYRARLSGSRTLIVLDNVFDENQIRALMPGPGSCFVLVTSRRRLRALDDAHLMKLEPLTHEHSITLLRRTAQLGPHHADEERLTTITELCGHVPLALKIAAALMRDGNTWSVRRVADQLARREAGRELTAYTDGSRSLESIFSLSYRTLAPAWQRLFFLLGVALAELLRFDGPWSRAIAVHSAAATSAEQNGDRLGCTNSLTNLAVVLRLSGDFRDASDALSEALRIYSDMSDGFGQAGALNELGRVRRQTGHLDDAARDLARALACYDQLGNQRGIRSQSSAVCSILPAISSTLQIRSTRRWMSIKPSTTASGKLT